MPIQTIDRGTAGDPTDKFKVGVAFDACQANDNYLDQIKADTIDTFANLALAAPKNGAGTIVNLQGHTTSGVGGGQFIAKAGSVTSDGGTQINSATGGLYWQRINFTELTVQMFGAIGDGIVADEGVAINLAIACAKANGYRRLFVPRGRYKIATSLTMTSIAGLEFCGEGTFTAALTDGSILEWTPASGTLFAQDSSNKVRVCELTFAYSNAAYSGKLCTTDNTAALDTSRGGFFNCNFAGIGAANLCSDLLNLKKSFAIRVEGCTFYNAQRGLTFTNYCNIINVTDCDFYGMVLNNSYMYSGVNQALNFYGCTFENLTSGKASAFDQVLGEAIQGFSFIGNWLGDVGTSGAAYWVRLSQATGIFIGGNFSGQSGSGAGDYQFELRNCSGIQISGNRLDDKLVNFAAACDGVVISANKIGSSTIGNIANATGISFISNSGLTGLSRSKGYLTANQSIPNATETAITWDGNFYDQVGPGATGTVHSTTVNNSRFTVPAGSAGLWEFRASVLINTAAAGQYTIKIRRNGTSQIAAVALPFSATIQERIQVVGEDIAAAGDYYELTVTQNSGGAVNVIGNAVATSDTHFVCSRVATYD